MLPILTDTEKYTSLMKKIWIYWRKMAIRKISRKLEEART